MQLGELQGQLTRFTERGANVVALSVDAPAHSRSMIRRMKLGFSIVSDQDQAVMQAYGVQNPDTRELALHAVYIVDESRQVIYRKVASRRPLSEELLDAIDFHTGNYPLADKRFEREATVVAFPKNNFQALIELSTSRGLPVGVDPEMILPTIELMQQGRSDDALIVYRHLVESLSVDHSEADLLRVAAWLVNQLVPLPTEAHLAGRGLSDALTRQRQSRELPAADSKSLDAVQKDLDLLRTLIRNNAVRWQLRFAKTMLRSYRELSLASIRD